MPPAFSLRCDWESAEELVGAVLRRARERAPQRALRARLEPGLPLLWCDAILLSQLLDNLIDNALKYSPDDAPVELLVRRLGEQVMLAVRDRGPGIAPALARTGVSGVPARRRSGRCARVVAGAGVAPRRRCRPGRVPRDRARARRRAAAARPRARRLQLRVPAAREDRAHATRRHRAHHRDAARAAGGRRSRPARDLRDALSVEGHEVLTAASLSEGHGACWRTPTSIWCCSISACPTATARPCWPRCGATATGRCW